MQKIFFSFLLLPFLFIGSASSKVVFLPNAPESVGNHTANAIQTTPQEQEPAELTPEEKCEAEGYEVECPGACRMCTYPTTKVQCPYDSAYMRCESPRCITEGYNARSLSDCVIAPGTSPSLEPCPYDNTYYKCVMTPLSTYYYCQRMGYNKKCDECGVNDLKQICSYDSTYCSCQSQ